MGSPTRVHHCICDLGGLLLQKLGLQAFLTHLEAMALETQLDTIESVDTDNHVVNLSYDDPPLMNGTSLPEIGLDVHQPECEVATKKPRLETGPRSCFGDKIKWVNAPTGLVPFVLNAETQVVHCGRDQMEIERIGSCTLIKCLSGCHPECSEGSGCQCLCHLLRAYYMGRQAL